MWNTSIVISFEPLCSRRNLVQIHRKIREKDSKSILLLGVPDGFLFDFTETLFPKISTQKPKILEIINGKGGGRPPIWQGKTEGLTEERLQIVYTFLRTLLE